MVADREIGAVAVGVIAVGQADVAPPGTAARDGRRREAAAPACSGGALVALGGPRIDQASVVEAVSHVALGVAQHHVAGAGGGGGAAEPPAPAIWCCATP